jgi:hypothetical protein
MALNQDDPITGYRPFRGRATAGLGSPTQAPGETATTSRRRPRRNASDAEVGEQRRKGLARRKRPSRVAGQEGAPPKRRRRIVGQEGSLVKRRRRIAGEEGAPPKRRAGARSPEERQIAERKRTAGTATEARPRIRRARNVGPKNVKLEARQKLRQKREERAKKFTERADGSKVKKIERRRNRFGSSAGAEVKTTPRRKRTQRQVGSKRRFSRV